MLLPKYKGPINEGGARILAFKPELPVRSSSGGLPSQFARLTQLSVWAGARQDFEPSVARREMALGFAGRRVGREVVPGNKFASGKARVIFKQAGARSRIMAPFGV